jgi:4,5-DOPA dioxygenase extradiol
MSSGDDDRALATAVADASIPANHPFAAHLRMAANLQQSVPHRRWEPTDGPLPALFVSHGAPMLFEMADWMSALHGWARALPRPRAILIVSAHWEGASLSVTNPEPSELVYDFGGFDPLYYSMRYDTPSAHGLVSEVVSLLPDTESVHEHSSRGLDHGAWVPLKIMYPEADVPVLQMSLPTHGVDRLVELGQRLSQLRDSGVLVIGSGFMTHGLRFIDWSKPDAVPGWSSDFDLWANATLASGDLDALANFKRAPGMPYAHPTTEHFTPLFVALGAATGSSAPVTTIDGFAIGLSKRSFQIQ